MSNTSNAILHSV